MNKVCKLFYLGPQGSYSDIAKDRFAIFQNSNCKFVPVDSIYKIVQLLKEFNSASVAAILPIENSIEGIVRDTQDNLIGLAELSIRIYAETRIPIEHSLIGYGNKCQIKTITSHPQALAQCREYIYRNWQDDIVIKPVLSTSIAVKTLSKDDITTVAIGSKHSAKMYNVPIIESKINDEENNTTRFVMLSKLTPKKSAINKVSITFSTENKSGALNKILNIIEKYGLNMSYIDSRPSRRELGEYVFYIDFEGHIEDSAVALALVEIQSCVKMLEILSQGAIYV